MFYETTYRVDTRETDPQGLCRPSALLGYLQETATQAALALGVERERMLTRYNAFWMMARIWVRLERPLYWNQEVMVRTWHRGGDRGVSMYRDFDLFQGGTSLGEAVSVWVLASADTRSMVRLSKAEELLGTSGEEFCKSKLLNKLRIPGPLELAEDRFLHYSDADVNGHVNNVRYGDFACDAIRLEETGRGRFVSELQISYLAECRPGETIRLSAGLHGETWYVEGQGIEGKSRFNAALLLRDIS